MGVRKCPPCSKTSPVTEFRICAETPDLTSGTFLVFLEGVLYKAAAADLLGVFGVASTETGFSLAPSSSSSSSSELEGERSLSLSDFRFGAEEID
ncbi:hypothetical protein ANANG_G00062820 [Anguilla anguilla]|uniref:Uncharacterized protein n=1 Tax=Anguilla anguilla TaxID=7936 RepID=A0A9D3S596_ANGAN|nr:hypothetical protein ANANG_G00062820 [Anguilla anguilla]